MRKYLNWSEYKEFIKSYNKLDKFQHIFQRRSLFSFFFFELMADIEFEEEDWADWEAEG